MASVDIIDEIIKSNPKIRELNLGEYKYVPRALDEKGRLRVHVVKCSRVKKGIADRIPSIKPKKGWDLALLSKVKMKDGSLRHIPQIDFECSVSNKNLEEIKNKLSNILKITPGYI